MEQTTPLQEQYHLMAIGTSRSGKSTMMNEIVSGNFREMDVNKMAGLNQINPLNQPKESS